MTRLLFTNLTMLVGLGALAIPILIHLLLRQRKRRLRFSTLRFFDRQDEQSTQRRKLRNLLLLAMRLLLLALLVLAFARPFFPTGQAAGSSQQRRLAVLVVDRTASLQASDGASPRWPRLREAVRRILAGLGPEDRAALISCGTRCDLLCGTAPPEVATRLFEPLQPGCGAASLGEGLGLAKQVVASAGGGYVPTVYVVSDLQASSCRNLSAFPLPAQLEVRPVPIGDVLAPNLAVASLAIETQGPEQPHTIIANFAAEDTKTVKLTLTIDEKEILARPVTLATTGVTRVDLTLPRLQPGWHSGTVRLEGADSLALDNARYDAFFIPQPVRALVVETRPGKRIFEEESYFVTRALDPMQGTTNAGFARFELVKVSAEVLARQLAPRKDESAIDLVILPGLKEIPSGLARSLAAFVEAGGGLLLFVGDDVNPSRYNTEFRDLLPAQLGHVERNNSDTPDQRWHLEEYDLFSPVFSVFRRPNSGNLALPEFTRRFTLITNQGVTVPARFGDDTLAIATRALGRGRVALVNTSADTAWTDWPKHRTFVPWLHSLCHWLAPRASAEPARTASHLSATDDADIALGGPAGRQSFRVVRPGKAETNAVADASGRLRNLDFGQPGIYSIRDRAGVEVQRVAVNVPGEESDLTALTPAEFQRQLTRLPEAQRDTLAAGLFGDKDGQKELWRFFLLAVLVLLFAEVFVANRSYA